MAFTPMASMDSTPTWVAQPDDYVVTNAAAAAITLPSPGYRLVRVAVTSGTAPSYVGITYDGISVAYFAAQSNGTNGYMAYALTWAFPGTNLPASIFTYSAVGTQPGTVLPTAVTYVFSKGKSMGPPIQNYRSVVASVASAGAQATITIITAAVTFSVAPAIPTGVIALGSAVAGAPVVYWPQIGSAQSGHSVDVVQGTLTLGKAPPLPKSTQISMYYTTLAACKILVLVGYDPA